jgi:hypothetical protein
VLTARRRAAARVDS